MHMKYDRDFKHLFQKTSLSKFNLFLITSFTLLTNGALGGFMRRLSISMRISDLHTVQFSALSCHSVATCYSFIHPIYKSFSLSYLTVHAV